MLLYPSFGAKLLENLRDDESSRPVTLRPATLLLSVQR